MSLCGQGSQEVSCTVDKKTGDIVLSFESCVMNQDSQFTWKKDYEEIRDFSTGMVVKTEGSRLEAARPRAATLLASQGLAKLPSLNTIRIFLTAVPS